MCMTHMLLLWKLVKKNYIDLYLLCQSDLASTLLELTNITTIVWLIREANRRERPSIKSEIESTKECECFLWGTTKKSSVTTHFLKSA